MESWEPLRDVIAQAIYDDPSHVGEHWPDMCDLPRYHELPEEKREHWRRDADRVMAALAARVGCTPRMERAAHALGIANPQQVLAAMMQAEMNL
jgi:hypothetical protein